MKHDRLVAASLPNQVWYSLYPMPQGCHILSLLFKGDFTALCIATLKVSTCISMAPPSTLFAVLPRQRRLRRRRVLLLTGLLLGLSWSSPKILALRAQSAPGRWLEVRQIARSVFIHTGEHRSAHVGDRLNNRGHGISTGRRASATLAVDLNIGTVTLAENTHITVQRLDVLSDGARVTLLQVHRGQARIQARPMNNPNSRFDLQIPNGIAAVRGTDFGVTIGEDQKTAVATLDGHVELTAQGVTVPVLTGFASVLRPGLPPTRPLPLDRELDIVWRSQSRQGNTIVLVGRINVANTLWQELEADSREIPIDQVGFFTVQLPLEPRSRTLTLSVRNPLGESRIHSLSFNRIPIR